MAAEIAQSHSLLYNPIAVGAIHFYWDYCYVHRRRQHGAQQLTCLLHLIREEGVHDEPLGRRAYI